MTKKQMKALMGLILTMFGALMIELFESQSEKRSIEIRSEQGNRFSTTTNAFVTKVIDGDTLEVLMDQASSPVKIRLLGINTPESVDPRRPVECFGKEASRFLQNIVDGKRVRLEEDLQADDRDKYGRWLRNVFLEDGTDVNALLVAQGYGHIYLSFPLGKQRKNQLRRLQEEAKLAQRGLWNVETCDGMK